MKRQAPARALRRGGASTALRDGGAPLLLFVLGLALGSLASWGTSARPLAWGEDAPASYSAELAATGAVGVDELRGRGPRSVSRSLLEAASLPLVVAPRFLATQAPAVSGARPGLLARPGARAGGSRAPPAAIRRAST